MSKRQLLLLVIYMSLAAGYGGWRGRGIWSDWGALCLQLPPVGWAGAAGVAAWRRNPYGISAWIGMATVAMAAVAVGGPAVTLACVAGEAAARVSAEPPVRAALGAGLVAAAGGLVWGAQPPGSHPSVEPESDGGSA